MGRMSTEMASPDQSSSISRPPTTGEVTFDRTFRGLTRAFAWITLLAVIALVVDVTWVGWPAMQEHGVGFLTGSRWGGGHYGIWPQIWGTLYSSIVGVALGTVFGVSIAIFLTEDFLPPKLALICKNIIELLAAIPSVVYGLWGIFVVIPAIRPTCNWLHENLGFFGLFGTPLRGPGLLPAALVLGIMVLPTITAISRDALAAVPNRLREAAYGLGATQWESILGVIVPTASRGIYGAIILAFGRALGETMALAMLVGNNSTVSWSLFSPADTLAAMLANRFPEASHVEMGLLMYAALVLLAITLLVNVVGTWIIRYTTIHPAGAKK
jgi:phosphate transport system permease protein